MLNLSPKTVPRHMNNLWVIGGEIIRQVNYEPQLRKLKPRTLLLDAIDLSEAKRLWRETRPKNNRISLDATARRLLRFLMKPDIG